MTVTNHCDGTATNLAAATDRVVAGAGAGGAAGDACDTPLRNCACTSAKRARLPSGKRHRYGPRPPFLVYNRHRQGLDAVADGDDHRTHTLPIGVCIRELSSAAAHRLLSRSSTYSPSGRPTNSRVARRSSVDNGLRHLHNRTQRTVSCNRLCATTTATRTSTAVRRRNDDSAWARPEALPQAAVQPGAVGFYTAGDGYDLPAATTYSCARDNLPPNNFWAQAWVRRGLAVKTKKTQTLS